MRELLLLQEAYEALAEQNAKSGGCHQCGTSRHDGHRFLHTDGCLMLRLRATLSLEAATE